MVVFFFYGYSQQNIHKEYKRIRWFILAINPTALIEKKAKRKGER
jgi:hypothetical protein